MKIETEGNVFESSIDTNHQRVSWFGKDGFVEGTPTGRFKFVTKTGEQFEISASGKNVYELAKISGHFKITIESVDPTTTTPSLLRQAASDLEFGYVNSAVAKISEALKRI